MFTVQSIIILVHILFVVVAVGAVTVVDYLHLVGLRKKKIEKNLSEIYPKLSTLINFSLFLIYLTGIFLVYKKPELLSSPLFIVKMFLVLLVTVNGIYLQKKVSPNLNLCVIKGTKYCSKGVLYSSAIFGSISIVTWYSILILAFTKKLNYTPWQFLIFYFSILIIVILTSIYIESRARKWR